MGVLLRKCMEFVTFCGQIPSFEVLYIRHLTAKLGIDFAFSNGVAERRHCKQKVKATYRIQKNLLIMFTVFYPQIGNFITHLTLDPVYIVYRFEIFLTADDAKTGFAAPSPPLLCAVSFWFDSFWRSSNLQGH